MAPRRMARPDAPALITGGADFVTNQAEHERLCGIIGGPGLGPPPRQTHEIRRPHAEGDLTSC